MYSVQLEPQRSRDKCLPLGQSAFHSKTEQKNLRMTLHKFKEATQEKEAQIINIFIKQQYAY